MTSKITLLEQFSEWLNYVKKLETYDENVWKKEIAKDKWSLRELVSHIMLWDKYFFEDAIEKIYKNELLTLQHLDFDEFNESAKEYGKQTSIQTIVEQSIHYREQIINHIVMIPEEMISECYVDEDGKIFDILQYLRDFIDHDQHHMSQMDNFISDNLVN
ncbi:DinB family protein [Paenibacillus crassostreae]|uniref:DinB-like domain-containing protein n=1 Tax=Paenibacillus crassostreae TaxID=1763538 RepID=A0A167FRR6_9BACL|nr:DinB family protein [Paenibacillus crassostreae]AOZ94127.1 hypothetical protein LPB68_19330 [Paenibacillus crassostreae]OAB76837.1 hypothetical protein PNBC_05410 [Paenibacillus crassostreae]